MTNIQEAIIDRLLADENLQITLGNTAIATGGVSEAYGFLIDNAVYPRVMVALTSEQPDQGVQQVSQISGKRLTKAVIDIHVFSKKTTSRQLSYIEQAVRVCLESKLSVPGIVIYNSEEDQLISRRRDEKTDLWHSITRYIINYRIL